MKTRRRFLKLSTTAIAAGVLSSVSSTTMSGANAAGGRVRLRAATNVNGSHILTLTIQKFLTAVEEAFPDEVHVEFFHSGQLYNDPSLAKAIYRGNLDFAAPTITILSRIVPDCGITALPSFYGVSADAVHKVVDGTIGQKINRRITDKLGAVVLGRYMDLGFADLFSLNSGITEREFEGLKIRVPSGAANILRLRALGAYPVMMPFADVPFALSQGVVDALETTADTVSTTQLWDTGLRQTIRQEAFLFQYIPLISNSFWSKASTQLRRAMVDIWEALTPDARAEAALRQDNARIDCERNGIEIVTPSPRQVDETRSLLEKEANGMIAHLGIDTDLARRARAVVRGGAA